MNRSPIDLYERLPAIYRRRDAENGYPLRALLESISEQANIVKHDIEGLLDDFFIQTSDEWAIPYIGDLVGNNALHEVVHRQRADVAKTIYYRRRKGTLPIIEEIARDVTGWGAHAVEFFELLEWTQHLNHLRHQRTDNPDGQNPPAMDRVGTVNIRNIDGLDRLDGPFDSLAHSVDIRPVTSRDGGHNVSSVGIFLWRLRSYPIEDVPAHPSKVSSDGTRYGYHVSPLGQDIQLFTNPAREADPTGLAREQHVPGPIRPLALTADLEDNRRGLRRGQLPSSEYVGRQWGGDVSLVIKRGDTVIPPGEVVCMDLSEWTRPPGELDYDGHTMPVTAGIDVTRGRLVFAPDEEPASDEEVTCGYCYGFSGDLGGGPYDRRRGGRSEASVNTVSKSDPDADYASLAQAFQDISTGGTDETVIEIQDNRVYDVPDEITAAGSLQIRAGNKRRPVLRAAGALEVTGRPGTDARLVLDGLLIQGDGVELRGAFEGLQIVDCTLVDVRAEEAEPAGIVDRSSADEEFHAAVEIERSVVGSILLDPDNYEVQVIDSIVEASRVGDAPSEEAAARFEIVGPIVDEALRPLIGRPSLVDALERFFAAENPRRSSGVDHAVAGRNGEAAGPPLTVERSTIFGAVHVRSIPVASETVFTRPVTVERRQTGCLRFSYVPPASTTPRRYQCQPDLAVEKREREYRAAFDRPLPEADRRRVRMRLRPTFTSRRYGDAAYAQLSVDCPEQLRTGGEDGAEMGVFNHLKQAHRETNLRTRLREYLPFGLEPGFIYVT